MRRPFALNAKAMTLRRRNDVFARLRELDFEPAARQKCGAEEFQQNIAWVIILVAFSAWELWPSVFFA